MEELNQLTKVFLKHLEKKGLEPKSIPAFLRDLEEALMVNQEPDMLQINLRLHSLGWDGFELDYRTLELAEVCLDS
jgi:hypothetical protein